MGDKVPFSFIFNDYTIPHAIEFTEQHNQLCYHLGKKAA